jgi:hypothetical protein
MTMTHAKRQPWPEGWTGGKAEDDYALKHGLNFIQEFEAFRDYHLAHGSKFADWSAAWRTWCRKAVLFSPQFSAPRPYIKVPDSTANPYSQHIGQQLRQEAEWAREQAEMRPEQRVANLAKIREMIAGIGRKT